MPRKWAETDFLQQVGKTVKGQPVRKAHQFEKMKVKRQYADERAKTHSALYRKGIVGDWEKALNSV